MTPETNKVFEQLDNALIQLEKATQIVVSSSRLEIDGTIQRFEFTIELFWKALKKKLADDYGIEVFGPKPVLQKSYAVKLISDEKIWLKMLDDRNMTSHTYKQDLADQIYENIKSYTPFLRKSFNLLQQSKN